MKAFRFGALRSKNARLYFGGQFISLVGTLMNMAATQWLAFQIGSRASLGSAVISVGVIAFAGQLPPLLLSPLAGVWVDRFNTRQLLIGTQIASLMQSFAMAALVYTQLMKFPLLVLMSLLQGFINALDGPARQVLYVDLVTDRKDLPNVIALNSILVHVARFIGPALAGFIIYRFGEAICFFLDGISYTGVVLALYHLQIQTRQVQRRTSKVFQDLKSGISYARSSDPIWYLLVLVAAISFCTGSLSVLMPEFASHILRGNEKTFGSLTGASGVGALVASLYLGFREKVVGLKSLSGVAGLVLGICMISFSFSRSVWLSVILSALASGCLLLLLASSTMILQTIVDDDKRGRVMSISTMAFLGIGPFGGLLASFSAAMIGAPLTLALNGVACTAISGFFLMQLPVLRPLCYELYRQKGIVP